MVERKIMNRCLNLSWLQPFLAQIRSDHESTVYLNKVNWKNILMYV